jgi:hypothetical protein
MGEEIKFKQAFSDAEREVSKEKLMASGQLEGIIY